MTKSTGSKPARKLPRTASTGQFEALSPLTDSSLRHDVLETIRAVDTLLPTLLLFAHEVSPEQESAMLGAMKVLVLIREIYTQHLHLDTPSGPLDTEAVVRIVERARAEWEPVFARLRAVALDKPSGVTKVLM